MPNMAACCRSMARPCHDKHIELGGGLHEHDALLMKSSIILLPVLHSIILLPCAIPATFSLAACLSVAMLL